MEKLAEVFFESFEVKNFHSANTAKLTLYSCGRTTGLVLNAGYQQTTATPVFEGITTQFNVQKQDLAG